MFADRHELGSAAIRRLREPFFITSAETWFGVSINLQSLEDHSLRVLLVR